MPDYIFPEWARWVAMDEDGLWWCYEAEPHMHDKGWYENEVGRSKKIILPNLTGKSWQQSLEKVNV